MLIVFLALGLGPKSRALGDEVAVLQVGAPGVAGPMLLPYLARYTTSTRVLGVPIKRGAIDVTLDRTDEGVAVTYGFGGGFTDEMLLDDETLGPVRRGFPGQRFLFEGNRVRAELGEEEASPDIRTFDFPGRVFEASVLDLVIVSGIDLPARIGWNNFADPAEWIAHAREVGAEAIRTAAGETFETRIVDIGFADGTIRRYWLANRPPYKIKQRTFERGRSIVSGWDLDQFQVR